MRRRAVHDHPRTRRRRRAVTAAVLAVLTSAPCAVASEWDAMRAQQRAALQAAGGRIVGIDSLERASPAERDKLADALTRDRIAEARRMLKEDGAGPAARADQTSRLLAATREWGPNGASRVALGASSATVQQSLELADRNLAAALEAVQATAKRVPQSRMLEALAAIDTTVSETGERLSARWQREHTARERERQQREREVGERERGVR
jgi:hypothetical protein